MNIDVGSLIAGILFGLFAALMIYLIYDAWKENQEIWERLLSRIHESEIATSIRMAKIERRLSELENKDNDEETD